MKGQQEKGFIMSSLVKIVLIGILIVAIPVSVKLVQEQQILKSRASEGECFEAYYSGPREGVCFWKHGTRDAAGQCQFITEDVDSRFCKCGEDRYYKGPREGVCFWEHGTLDEFSRCQTITEDVDSRFCGDSGVGGTPVVPGAGAPVAPSQPEESNYCEAAGYHKCGTVGANLGSCTQDGKSCTKYETYQCNFEGTNYCGDSAEQPECRDCQLSNVGVGTPDASSVPDASSIPAGGTAPSGETEDKPCKVPMASFSGNSSCTMVPNNSYKWVIIQPGTGGAPGIDVAKFGANNACGDPGGDREAAHEVCPENTSDPLNVRASTSNWCYEFTEGNRCIQLRHDGTGGGPGGGGSPGIDTGTCNIDGQSPDLGPTCAACLGSKVPAVVSNIKGMNPTDFNGCSDQKIFNKWCNGFGGEAKGQCDALKVGACATSCGGSLPDPGPANPVRRDLCVSTALSTETIAANGQITITTAAKEDKLRKFRYAFFNLDNGAKIICQQGIASVPDAKPAEQCPNGGVPFVVDEPAASANAKSQAATLSFTQFDKPDLNWGGKKPTHIQVNGYFIDQFGMQSTANSTCSKGFNIAQGEVPSQIQFRAAESSFEDQETGWQPYTGAGMLHNYTFKDKTPGVKTIFVQFKDLTTGKIQDASAQIELVAPPSPPPSPPPVVTKEFRIAESPTDLNSAQWQPYNSVPMKYDNFEFKDKKPGVKTIFVQFRDSNDKVSCGGNKTYCTTQIRLLGDDPAITNCSLGFEGNNTILNLTGKNFGSTKGIIKSGEAVLQVKGSWRDDSVQAILPNAQPGQNIPVTLTNTDGQTGEIPCSSVSQLSLGAKLFCRQPALHQTDNVDLTIVEAFAGGKKFNQKVTIDKDGIVQGLTQKLESGKDYVLSIKAPRSLRKNAPFKAGEGVTKIPNFTLWVGDIFPADGGDGLINSLDKQQLNREWNITSDVKGRSGDFNQDGRVNSIDWACMRVSMVDSAGRGDDPEPVPGIQVSPGGSLQSPGPSTSPAASPVASPSPSASPAI